VRCPTCKQPVPPEEYRFRPFCSTRCRMIDLGKWLGGEHVIPGEPATDEDLSASGEAPPEKPPGRG
jgi:uncharacterized protein